MKWKYATACLILFTLILIVANLSFFLSLLKILIFIVVLLLLLGLIINFLSPVLFKKYKEFWLSILIFLNTHLCNFFALSYCETPELIRETSIFVSKCKNKQLNSIILKGMSRFAVNFIYFSSSLFGASLNYIFVSAAVMIPIIFLVLLFLNGSILGYIFGSYLIPAFLLTFVFVFFLCAAGQMNEVMSSKQARLGNAASYLSSQTSWFGQLLQLEALNILIEDGSPEGLEILVNVFSDCKETIVLHKILNYLEQISDQDSIDIVCAGWARNRHKDLASLLIKKDWVALEPIDIRVLTALNTKHFQIITDRGEEIVEPLLSLFDDRDSEIANRASECAISLNNSEAIESLCRLVIEQDHPIARQVALTAKYVPQDPVQKALFYFLTEQWDKYEGLDFDQTLLQKAHELADEKLSKRIAEKLRKAGRVEWLKVIAGGNQPKKLEVMTDDEWETTLIVLNNSQQWDEMWRLVQKAPPIWSKKLFQQMKRVRWMPKEEQEQVVFEKLTLLADKCLGDMPSIGSQMLYCKETFTGHGRNYSVIGISFSPSGQLLASCSNNGTIRLWQMPNGQPLATFTGHYGLVWDVSFSPNGQILASCGGTDRTIGLWQIPDCQALATLTGHNDEIREINFSPDGQILASCSHDKTIRLWKMPNGRRIAILSGHSDAVNSINFSPDGQILASGSKDGTIRLWQIPSGRCIATLSGHNDEIMGISFSPNGQILASCSRGIIKLWKMPDGKLLTTLTGNDWDDYGHKDWIWGVSFSPDGQILASCSADRTIRLWQMPDGQALATITGHNNQIMDISFSPDGQTLASCSTDESIKLWSSDLVQIIRLSIKQLNQQKREWIEKTLQSDKITEQERHWLEFMQALMDWHQHCHQRFDVEVEDATQSVSTNEFDIEIEG